MHLLFILFIFQLTYVYGSKNNNPNFIPESGKLITAKKPVILSDLKRVTGYRESKNDTSIYYKTAKTSKPRSSPLLFQRALGLKPGQPFIFRLDKWKGLQASGLFRELTAKGKTDPKTGNIFVEIKGQELPSVRFTPEVSVGASIENPEASGGISFEDKNFMGMGQNLEISVAKKEGQQVGVAELPASIRLKWTDSKVCQTPKVSAIYEEEHQLMEVFEQSPIFSSKGKSSSYHDGDMPLSQIPTAIRRSFVTFKDDFVFMNPFKTSSSSSSSSSSSNNMKDNMEVSGKPWLLRMQMEPYRTKVVSDLWSDSSSSSKRKKNKQYKEDEEVNGLLGWFIQQTAQLDGDTSAERGGLFLYGAETRANLESPNGNSYSLKIDNGLTALARRIRLKKSKNKDSIKEKKFHEFRSTTISAKRVYNDLATAELSYPSWVTKPWRLIPYLISNSSGDSGGVDLSELTKSSIDISAVTKVMCGMSQGEGCTPHFHMTDLGESRILRGYQSDDLMGRRVGKFAALKTDLYLDDRRSNPKSWGIFGLFADTAIFSTDGVAPMDIALNFKGFHNGNKVEKDKKDRKNSASNSNRHQTTMGLSFRSRGLRADVGWPLDFSTPPKLYLNVDVD